VNNNKHFIAIALAALLFGASSACQNAGNKNTAVNQASNANSTNTNTAIPANTATPGTPVNTTSTGAGTPTDAYKAAYAARKNKDVPGLKKLLSKDILEFFTIIAEADEKKKQTVDEVLMELCVKEQAATAEVRNEKINGDKATIEYLDEKGGWSPMDFIKEDGVWKLTIERPEKGDIEVSPPLPAKKK